MKYEIQYDAASRMYLVFRAGCLVHIAIFSKEWDAEEYVARLIKSDLNAGNKNTL